MTVLQKGNLRTRRRIVTRYRQFRDYNNLDLFLPLDIFKPHTGPSGALENLNMLRTILDGQRTSIFSLAELWSSRVSKGTNSNKNNLIRMYLQNKL